MFKNKIKNIIIVAHKFLTQPDDDLVIFLNKKEYDNVLHIRHSFSDAPDRRSYYTWYKNGEIYEEYRTKDYKKLSEPLIYLKEFYFTLKWVWQSRIKWDRYIGMDGLCVFFGNFLRLFEKVKHTIYWVIDFVPKGRFKSGLKDKIYHIVNIYGYKHADEMWDLSPRMAEGREKFLGIELSDYKLHKVVPQGAWCGRIKRYSYEECEKNTLVFMGHLLEKQGVHLVVKAIPEIIKKIPNFRFKIIGGGRYKKSLIQLARDLGVIQYCDFKGKIEDHREVEKEIAKSGLAIAPYIKKLDTWTYTYYADSGKAKTYLACSVPVLLTDITWNAGEIEKNKCGIIISECQEDIIAKITFLMSKNTNQVYRDNAFVYSQRFDYNSIFDRLNI